MANQLTLLQINETANVGSHGRIAESIGLLAKSKDWRSVIAYGRSVSSSQNELLRIGNRLDIYEHLIESRLFDHHGLASRVATRRFINQLKELKPDVIHLHNLHGYYLNYQYLFEYLNSVQVPVVWTLHDCWAFTGHCGHFVMAGCERWKTGCGLCPIFRSEYPRAFFDRSARNYALKKALFEANSNLHIVCVSEWLAGLVKQSFLKDKDIRVINNGIDLDVFQPLSFRIGNRFRILGVSNVWTKEKGLFDFYRLRELLDPEFYDITLIGLKKEQISKLPKGIVGVERTKSASELAAYYSSASVFVNPTYADTFPTVNLEALACGSPVVTYNTGGSPEAVDAMTGIVVEKGNIQGLLDAIQEFSKKDRTELREACRNRAVSLFNKNDRFQDYINLYKELLHE